MTTVLIRRNAPTDSCHNLTALMPRCTKTSFLITPHYICAHRNSDNLHYAAFKGYSLVGEWQTSTLLWSYISCSPVSLSFLLPNSAMVLPCFHVLDSIPSLLTSLILHASIFCHNPATCCCVSEWLHVWRPGSWGPDGIQ